MPHPASKGNFFLKLTQLKEKTVPAPKPCEEESQCSLILSITFRNVFKKRRQATAMRSSTRCDTKNDQLKDITDEILQLNSSEYYTTDSKLLSN